MRPENKRMKEFLAQENIVATPKYLSTGSLKGCWRLYHPDKLWTVDLWTALNNMEFVGFDGKPLHQFSGNGGRFSVYVRGHYELLQEG